MKITDENLKGLGQLLDPTGIITKTRQELLDAFKKILELVNKMKEENNKKMNEISTTFDSLKTKLDSDTSTTLTKTERTVAAELESLLRRFSAEQKKIDDRLAILRDGIDADEDKIVSDVLSQIRLPEYKETVLDNGEQILEKITGLVEISDIKGMEKEIEELKKIRRLGGGGGFSKIAMDSHFIDDETLSGTPNGTLTDFTIVHAPNPSTSLKVFVNGQKMKLTTDYTLSGKTITFTTAPPTGSILLCDYRI